MAKFYELNPEHIVNLDHVVSVTTQRVMDCTQPGQEREKYYLVLETVTGAKHKTEEGYNHDGILTEYAEVVEAMSAPGNFYQRF